MGAKKQKKYYTKKQLLEEVIQGWSSRTLERRIEEEGFPYIQDGEKGRMFDIEDVERWFKERKQNVS